MKEGYTYIKGDVIAERIKKTGMNNTILANLIGIDNSSLGKAIKGTAPIAIAKAEKMCTILSLTMPEVIQKEPVKKEVGAVAPQINIDLTEITELVAQVVQTNKVIRAEIKLNREATKELLEENNKTIARLEAMQRETKEMVLMIHNLINQRFPAKRP